MNIAPFGNWITFDVDPSSVPPSSTASVVTLTGCAHWRRSSVAPLWTVNGAGWEEMATWQFRLSCVLLSTTVPPQMSAPRSMRWSEWLFASVNLPAPFLTSCG